MLAKTIWPVATAIKKLQHLAQVVQDGPGLGPRPSPRDRHRGGQLSQHLVLHLDHQRAGGQETQRLNLHKNEFKDKDMNENLIKEKMIPRTLKKQDINKDRRYQGQTLPRTECEQEQDDNKDRPRLSRLVYHLPTPLIVQLLLQFLPGFGLMPELDGQQSNLEGPASQC